jgi:uncharacterized oligopeptide transporter (OPT) family protein
MALFQTPPRTPDEASRPLSTPPDEVARMTEAEWYASIYRGDDVPQLTFRAVAMGSFLGIFLAFTNVYIGLKTGWHLGVAITACILSFTLWRTLLRTGMARSDMTILETNCMQSTASSAGYSTGSTIVSAFPALLMLSATQDNPGGEHLPWFLLAGWTALIAILGVTLAIPMKRNLINEERLRFPSGLAAATTLQSLHSSGSAAVKQGRALLVSAAIGGVFPLLLDLRLRITEAGRRTLLPGHLDVFDRLGIPARGVAEDGSRLKPSDWTLTLDLNPVMIAAGALVGLRTTVWMVIGGLTLAYVAGPMGLDAAWQNPAGQTVFATSHPGKAWKEIGLWIGAPIMVASGLLAFAFQWRTVARAFSGLSARASGEASAEVPFSWFAVGAGAAAVGTVILAWWAFDIPVLLGALAIVLTFFLALVAARATGETDITPTGAMGKIMQLTYGVLIPQSATANLMTAGITAGSAAATADLLNDLKSGYLLGADPRRQFIAQALGILSGTLATVSAYYLLIPDATALLGTATESPAFPAPAAQAWKAVAEVFKQGIEHMHPMHQRAIVVGLVAGAVAVLLDRLFPRWRAYMPSATGLGLGFILPFQYPFSMFLGAVLVSLWTAKAPASAKDYMVPVASGIIAGVSVVGVVVAGLNNFVLVG